MSNGRGRSIEEPEHPAWAAWLEHTGHIPGTTMGLDSSWQDFKAGWEAEACLRTLIAQMPAPFQALTVGIQIEKKSKCCNEAVKKLPMGYVCTQCNLTCEAV